MNKLRTPFNVTSVGQAAALAALGDAEHVRRSVETNRVQRKRIFDELSAMGIKAIPSETNFVFLDVGADGKNICDDLLRSGVIVRPLAWMGFPQAVRVSVGSEEQNRHLLDAMRRVFKERANGALASL